MILFNKNQLNKVEKVINKNVLMFITKVFGTNVLSDNDKLLLNSYGVDIDKYPPSPTNTIFGLAFMFGMYKNNTDTHKAKGISKYEFEKIISSNKFLPLNEREKASLESVNLDVTRDIKKFATGLNTKVNIILSEVDKVNRAKLESKTFEKTKQAVIKRQAVKEFASELFHETKDIQRDWIRVAQYNLFAAKDQGEAMEIERLYGKDAIVYKYVYPQACKSCQELYLTNGFGSKPIFFKLSELRANGTNIGVNKADWKPVIGGTHPFCYSKDTEVLTNEGWKLFKDLIGNEEILSLNLETLNSEWTNINKRIRYICEGKMQSFVSNSFDLLTTDNHKHVINTEKLKKWRLISGDKIMKKSSFLKTIPNYIGNNEDHIYIGDCKFKTNDFVEFIAYYLSEGSISNRHENYSEIHIAQEKNNIKSHHQEIFDCAKRLFDINVFSCMGAIQINIKDKKLIEYLTDLGKCNEKYIPKEIKELSKEYLTLFLKAYSITDGHVRKPKIWKNYLFSSETCYYTTSDQLASDLGELILKIGKSVTYSKSKIKTIKFKNGTYTQNYEVWTIRQNQRQTALSNKMDIKYIDYNDFVYCVELEKNNTLFVRRNGKVCVSGNCRCPLTEPPFGQVWQDDINGFGKIKETRAEFVEKLMERDRQIVKKKMERGDLPANFLETYVPKVYKSMDFVKKTTNEIHEHDEEIISDYLCVNEYEKEFKEDFAKMIGNTLNEVVKELYKLV